MTRLLLIDDDKVFVTEAREELELLGFEVAVAHTFTEAVALMKGGVKYDVISLDVMMRIESDEQIDREAAERGLYTGLLIYKEARRLCPDAKVIVLTVLEADERARGRVKATVEPGTEILSKTVSLSDYVKCIRVLVPGSQVNKNG